MAHLRVAHIITQLELGGAQRNTLYTVTHLNPERFETCLISGVGGILDEEARSAKTHCFFIPSLIRAVRPWHDLIALIQIYRTLRLVQPDVVHTHSSKAGILGRIAAYLAGVPVIVHTYHGFGITPQQTKGLQKLFIGAERFCAKLATHLIFVSESNRRTAETLRIGVNKPWSLIRSGIPMHPDHPADSAFAGENLRRSEKCIQDKLKIPSNAWVVTYVGNFKPQKNTRDIIRVAERTLLLAPDIHFLLIGNGEERDAVRAYAEERHVQDRVHFLGWLKRKDDIQEVMSFSKCFLMTSLWEGLPRALVEAFASRVPAVAYAVDGITDILKDGETGFPIPPGDIELAAQKLLWLKANPEKAREMGNRGRQLIEKDFDIDYMVRQQEELYDKLFEAVPLKEAYHLQRHA